MARIVISTYMIRFPMGGMMSWVLHFLVGLRKLGHDIYLVEKAGYANACFDPTRGGNSDDCEYGTRTVDSLLKSHGLGDRWCFVDAHQRYHGLTREAVQAIFDKSDLFLEMGGVIDSWLDEAAGCGLRVLLDIEPGMTQMEMENERAAGINPPAFDYYYTYGRNIGTDRSAVPTVGKSWRKYVVPIVMDFFPFEPADLHAPYTTVMNWNVGKPVQYAGRTYGFKELEFPKFESLPKLTKSPLEVAVSGKKVPRESLARSGWRVRDANAIATSVDAYFEYIRRSRGEFTVVKNYHVAMNDGWFGEREAAFLASGRPVIVQETGWSAHVPSGQGLFAVRTVDEAAAAIDEIERDYDRHSQAARAIANEHFDAAKVLGKLLDELGV